MRRYGSDAMRPRERAGGRLDARGRPEHARGRDREPVRPPRRRPGADGRLAPGHRARRGPLRRPARRARGDRRRAAHRRAGRGGGFADEEGLRFNTAYLGSAPLAGRFDPAWPGFTDEDGVALADVLPGDPATAVRTDVRAYAEVHIEQGPVLERLGEPVGVVTAINGQSHAEVTFVGEAGHAGTVPLDDRRDALAAAAEWVLAVEGTGTVGPPGRRARRAQRDPRPRGHDPGRPRSRRRHPPRCRGPVARARGERSRRGEAWRSSGSTAATSPPWRWTRACPRPGASACACPAAPATTPR